MSETPPGTMLPLAPRAVSPFDDPVPDPPFVWAHRGASALAPENTMAAFLLAVELVADGIELDVQLTRDGQPIVLHDPRLHYDGKDFHLHAKTDGSTRPIFVGDIDFADIAAAPVVFPDGGREPLERLEAVLDALPSWTWLDVELKAGWTYDPRLAAVVARCLAARPERCLVSSFDHVVLAELHALSPEVPLAALCDARLADPRAVLSPIPARLWNLRRAFMTKQDVVSLRAEGVLVSLYGEELLFDLAELRTWQLAGIFLDDPRQAYAPPTLAEPA
jgi:glycerophosphoryl diester phosphodiesterase